MTLNEVMKDTADAIREKTGKSELIAPVDFASEIKGITAGGGESNFTYYRYDYDNAIAMWGDNSTEFSLILYANMVGCLDITGISTYGELMTFAGAIYSVCQDALEGSNSRIPLSYYATKPNTIMGKHNPSVAEQVTNMHDFIRLVGKEMMQWSEEQINAAVALFTEISEEEFFAAITA
jgi:hypothetical protein